jgi:hypothetical protein
VDSAFFGVFIDAGYLGLHRHTVGELKQLKSVPEGEDYLDNITRYERELRAFEAQGLTGLHVAFSREHEERKVYVQDLIRGCMGELKMQRSSTQTRPVYCFFMSLVYSLKP